MACRYQETVTDHRKNKKTKWCNKWHDLCSKCNFCDRVEKEKETFR